MNCCEKHGDDIMKNVVKREDFGTENVADWVMKITLKEVSEDSGTLFFLILTLLQGNIL